MPFMFARFVYALFVLCWVFVRVSFLQNPKKTWTFIVDQSFYINNKDLGKSLPNSWVYMTETGRSRAESRHR